MITPIALQNISWKFYVILGIFNSLTALGCYFLLVETKGKSLEEIDRYFAEKYHGGQELREVEQIVESKYDDAGRSENPLQGDKTGTAEEQEMA